MATPTNSARGAAASPPPAIARQIADYLGAFWPSLPPQHIQMNPRGAKYSWVKTKPKDGEHIPLDQAALLAHAAGKRTIGAKLQDSSDRANKGKLDIDAGGRGAIVRSLVAAEQLGLAAYAIVMPGEPHDGGRVIVAYDDFYPAANIRAQMTQIVKLAELPADTEIWPCEQAVALPFGYHVRKHTRGELLLQTGESIKLDDNLAAGFEAVQALPLNSAPPAPLEPEPAPAPARPAAAKIISLQPRQQAGRASLDDVRSEFNAQHTLDELLISYGAQRTKDGYTCPFCTHSHQTTLYISRQGKLFSFSPNCKLYTTKGHNPFGLYVLVEHNNSVISAAKALNPIEPRRRQAEQPPLVEPEQRQQTPAQAADAQRKRETRAAAAAEIRAAVEQRAQQDRRLTPCDRATLGAMLAWAAEHASACCWLGRASIAERSGYSLGSVKRSVMLLEQYGYFESTGEGGRPIDTAKRTFTRGSSLQTETIFVANDDPRKILASDHDLTLGASERAPLPQPPAPAVDWLAVLSYVQGLAAELGEAPRDYEGLNQAQLEQEAARLEQLLSSPAEPEPQPVAEPGGASYDPRAALPLVGKAYSARTKDRLEPAELWAAAASAIKARTDVVEQPPAEQQQLDDAPPRLQACPPAPSDPRYREFAQRWYASRQEWRKPGQRAYFERKALELCDQAEPSEAARRWLAFKRPPASLGLTGARTGAPSQARAAGPPLAAHKARPALFAQQALL